MIYLPELFYLQDEKDFPFQKAVTVTAAAVSRWSSFYHAQLISPAVKQIDPREKSGPLPAGALARETFVRDLVGWLFEYSMVEGLFCLFLDDEIVPKTGSAAKFDHHDDTCCWVLNLTEKEFVELQSVWRANGLPDDLFYPQQEQICVPYPGTGIKARLLRLLKAQMCTTPRRWEHEAVRRNGGPFST